MSSGPQPSPLWPASDRTPAALRELLGTLVIVDTDAAFIYLGRLEGADPEFLRLEEVDAHEISKASLSKERYVHEARNIGVRSNRKCTWVNMARVISISRLEDVVVF